MKAAIKAMRIYAKTVELGSMSRAAITLGISTSGVSQQIRRLEQDLEVSLLHRNTRKLALTEAGDVFYRHCLNVLESMTEAERELDMFKQQPLGALRLFAPVGFAGSGILSAPLQHLMDSYPQLKLDLLVADEHIDMVGQRIDIALRVTSGGLPDSSLIARQVGSWKMGLYVAASYLDKHKLSANQALSSTAFATSSSDVSHCRLLHNNENSDIVMALAPSLAASLQTQLRVNNMQTLTQLTLDGLGIALLPEPEVRGAVAAGQLVQVMTDISVPKLDIYAMTTHKAPHPAKISAALSAIEVAFTQLH